MIVTVDDRQFRKDMANIIAYANGFFEGVELGRPKLLVQVGTMAIEGFKKFVDSNARVNPQALQHVYEWYKSGSPDARLFDLDYNVTSGGLTIHSSFRQSNSIKDGSNVPFYDKARIMEYGVPVTITPKRSEVLVFEENGEAVFTKNPVTVSDPGGREAQGAYEETFNIFFNQYFTQSYLRASGLLQHLSRPKAFDTNMPAGKNGGKSVGVKAGYNWISKEMISE